MNPNQVVDDVKTKLAGAFAHFQEELKKSVQGVHIQASLMV